MPDAETLPTAEECIAAIAKVLNGCLVQLDHLRVWQAGAHLSQAIAALPGQTAVPPPEFHEPSN